MKRPRLTEGRKRVYNQRHRTLLRRDKEMTDAPMYEIWGCDLNGLYEPSTGRPDVFLEDCMTYAEAAKVRDEWQTHDQAAWIVNKETREVVN